MVPIARAVAAVWFLVPWAAAAGASEVSPLVVASGEPAGVFLPEAAAICATINKDQEHRRRLCLIESTAGSTANLGLLRDGSAAVAIVQSRMAAEAWAGRGMFANSPPQSDLRALFSLHGEALMVMTHPDAGINSPLDLKGKRVNLGRPGGFQRLMAEALLAAEGLRPSDFASVLELDPAQEVKALCANEIDAAFLSGVHPMPEVEEAIDQCGAAPLPLHDAAIDAFLKANPYYVHLNVAPGVYQGVDLDTPSFGPRSIAVATTALSEQDAYDMVKTVFDNQAEFKKMHPLLSELDKKLMAREASVIPLHDGAKRYFRENHLLP